MNLTEIQGQHLKKPDRNVVNLILHCTGTLKTASPQGILNYWRNNLGWKSPGYHILIGLDRTYKLLDLNRVSNGARGYNHNSIHIAYIGGLLKCMNDLPHETNEQGLYFLDTRNNYQFCEMEKWCKYFNELYENKLNIAGHNEISNKSCPCFDVKEWLKIVGI